MRITLRTDHSLYDVIRGCKQGVPAAQRSLYDRYYGFGMTVCMRYAKNTEEAVEILNDGFIKVFGAISGFIVPDNEDTLPKLFMAWVKKIMINTGINHFKLFQKFYMLNQSTTNVERQVAAKEIDNLAYEELLQLIQKLSPAYRNTFCLYAIDGYKHEEIAELMGISVGTSKSNLLKARKNLRKMLEQINE